MKTIKSTHADLETKRFIFFEIGFIITLGLIFFSLEIKTYVSQKTDFSFNSFSNEQEEMIEITQQEKPEPPTPKTIQSATIIEIVENETEVEDEIQIDVETDQETVIEEFIAYIPEEEEEEVGVEDEPIFVIVESMPEFPGGENERLRFLSNNIKYPAMAREAGIQGTVYVTFIVELNGKIKNVEVLRGIGGGCDEEAVRVVESMPNWIPGKQRNVAVRVQFNMPIRFVLI